MLVRLSELLRITMAHTGAPETTLRDEVAFLERYLDIERIRFHDRLEVTIAIDEDAIDAQVPSLILQPMVENAMRHGVEPSRPDGPDRAPGGPPEGNLVLTVSDNGGGSRPRARPGGHRLANTRARLAELYGAQQHFELVDRPEGGLCVRIMFLHPLRAVTKLRIIVADDEPLARARLIALLPKDLSIEVTGEYATGTEAVEAIRQDKPDIAFLDMQMPGCDGLQVVAGIDPANRPASCLSPRTTSSPWTPSASGPSTTSSSPLTASASRPRSSGRPST